MSALMTDVMRSINNFFENGYIDGEFSIDELGQLISFDGMLSGQMIAITGSTFHNGVWEIAGGMLQDMEEELPGETFTGRVYTLAPPPSFLRMCREISEFQVKQMEANSPKTAESFGGYSYTIATANGAPVTWQEAFASRMRQWRHMFTEVDL